MAWTDRMATSFMDGSFLECPPRSPWAARRAETTVPPGCFASRSCVVRPPIQAPTDATSAHHESAGCASRSRRTTIYAARGRRSYHGGRDLGGRGRSAFPPPVAPQLRHEPRAPGRGHPCRPAPDGPFQHRDDHQVPASLGRGSPRSRRPSLPRRLRGLPAESAHPLRRLLVLQGSEKIAQIGSTDYVENLSQSGSGES